MENYVSVKSEQAGIRVKRQGAVYFNYTFKTDAIEMPLEHAEYLIKNPNFTIEGKKIKKKVEEVRTSYKDELLSITGIGSKIAKDIMIIYPTKDKLLKAISLDEDIPLEDDVEKKLKIKYGGN